MALPLARREGLAGLSGRSSDELQTKHDQDD